MELLEQLQVYANSLFESHRQELNELQEIHGAKNVTDFFYSEHRGSWIVKFKEGEDQEFDTKQEMIQVDYH